MNKETTSQPKPIRIKGTGIFMGKEFCFQPSEPGEPTQLNVRTCKGGKTYKTTSETKPLQVVHLSCPANAADPYAEYLSQLDRLGIKPQTEKPQQQKQRVISEGGMEVFLDSKACRLTYHGCIDLQHNCNWQSEVMRQVQIIARTLPVNEKFKRIITKVKKGLSK
jgi:hypothetical protein